MARDWRGAKPERVTTPDLWDELRLDQDRYVPPIEEDFIRSEDAERVRVPTSHHALMEAYGGGGFDS